MDDARISKLVECWELVEMALRRYCFKAVSTVKFHEIELLSKHYAKDVQIKSWKISPVMVHETQRISWN